MRKAFHGADAVFLYCFTPPDQLDELVSEMTLAEVSKVVVLSTIDTTRSEDFVEYNKGRHLAVENAIAAAGFAHVCLRPGAFARNAVRFWAEQIRRDRRVRLPFPDSQQAPIADEDIAAVAVQALTTADLDGQRIVLTGPRSLTMTQQIGLISDAIAEPIAIDEIAEPEARALYGQVLPQEYLDLLMGQWSYERSEPAVVTTAVEHITGRPPTTYASWATANRLHFL
ncbi:NAD(P)H-binding protein [Mycobacterium sp. BMJ-28]